MLQECKTLFEDLSSIMRTVLASRSEIVEYDKRQQISASEKVDVDANRRVSFESHCFKKLARELTAFSHHSLALSLHHSQKSNKIFIMLAT